jgi:hypothetical protein
MMEFVNGKDDIPYLMENKTCSKPHQKNIHQDIIIMIHLAMISSIPMGPTVPLSRWFQVG